MGKFNKYLTEETDDTEDKILAFFAENPSPPDSKVHAMAEKLGIEPDNFESMIYKILGSILGSGFAKKKGVTEKDVDQKELKMGIKVEMEHTTNAAVAKRIAIDHLAEMPDYYTKLAKMEGGD